MAADPRIQQVIQLIRDNKKAEAHQLITVLLNEKPQDADLLYFAAAASDGDKRIDYLRRALTVNPNHARSKAMLDKLSPSVADQPISPVPTASPSRANPLGWAIAALVVIALIAASAFGGYQVGHDAGLRSLGNTMAVAFYGNEASQTAYPAYKQTSDASYDATRNAIEASYGATSTAMYVEATAQAVSFAGTRAAIMATNTAVAIDNLATQTAAAVVVPTDPPPPTALQTGEWQFSTNTSALDDKESKFLLLDANEKIQNLFTSYLAVVCQSGTLRIALGSDITFETANSVTIRLDKEPAKDVRIIVSDDGKVIAFTNSSQLLIDLTTHQNLVVAAETFLYGREILTFNITGLSEAMTPMNKDCGK